MAWIRHQRDSVVHCLCKDRTEEREDLVIARCDNLIREPKRFYRPSEPTERGELCP